MIERDLEKRLFSELEKVLRPPLNLWKIRDEVTVGQPDMEVSWNGSTTKLELKYVHPGERIHDKWHPPPSDGNDSRQLMSCVKYEQATSRCWVVAFCEHKPGKSRSTIWTETIVYRPTALLHGKDPVEGEYDVRMSEPVDLRRLWTAGHLRFDGYNMHGIAGLIMGTHGSWIP